MVLIISWKRYYFLHWGGGTNFSSGLGEYGFTVALHAVDISDCFKYAYIKFWFSRVTRSEKKFSELSSSIRYADHEIQLKHSDIIYDDVLYYFFKTTSRMLITIHSSHNEV